MVPYHCIHLYLLVMIAVQVNCFRTPLPFGTGYLGTKPDNELSDQGIFQLLWKSLSYEPSKEAKAEGNVTARGYLPTHGQQLENYIYYMVFLSLDDRYEDILDYLSPKIWDTVDYFTETYQPSVTLPHYLITKGRLRLRNYEDKTCLPGWPGWPDCVWIKWYNQS